MRLILIVLFGVLVGCTNNPELPNLGASLSESSLINSQKFSTYSVFFFARSTSLSDSEKHKTKALKESFELFSSGIGSNNIGIWVGQSTDKFSMIESKNLCDKYNLSYNGGPYIVVSRKNPLRSPKAENDLVLNFDGINHNRIQYVLNEVEQDIRRGEYYKTGKSEEYKQFILSEYDNNKDFIKDVVREILEILKSSKKT